MTALLAFLGAVQASPVDLLEKRRAFSVSQVEKGKYYKNGAIAISKTFQKYNKEVPAVVAAAAAAAATGEVSATPEDAYDSLYLSPVSVGGTTLELDFDTGSADL
jgi:aspergillopepsin I